MHRVLSQQRPGRPGWSQRFGALVRCSTITDVALSVECRACSARVSTQRHVLLAECRACSAAGTAGRASSALRQGGEARGGDPGRALPLLCETGGAPRMDRSQRSFPFQTIRDAELPAVTSLALSGRGSFVGGGWLLASGLCVLLRLT